ncbi:uncharacterized protein LOC119319507 isoform X1 [Triticum dicoccoides]|uniref:uncharacterized protein LOC119319507 isoform X1 n=1 Tax=Triticum dicoccoides TaxID=85692 RepID=UPI00189128AD|nr:uncharacterized protein LOC119319507 isoform X1 [Triticum dicoccoides]
MSCTKCHKTSQSYGTTYKCIDPGCSCTDALPRYRICFVVTDGTREAEFVFFDRAGKEIIGKSLITLLRGGKSSRVPLEEIVRVAHGDDTVPQEIAALVGQKYRFVVSISTKSFLPESKETSFQVNRIDVPTERCLRNAVMYRKADSSGQSGSNTDSQSTHVASFSSEALPAGSVPPLLMSSQDAEQTLMETQPKVHLLLLLFRLFCYPLLSLCSVLLILHPDVCQAPITPKGKSTDASLDSVNQSGTKRGLTKHPVASTQLRKPLFPNKSTRVFISPCLAQKTQTCVGRVLVNDQPF